MPFLVPSEMTLQEALLHFFPDSSKRTRLQWIKFKRVFVDGKIALRANDKVTSMQTIEIGKKEEVLSFRGIKILYQDRAFVVIDKPTNLLSVASENPAEEHALALMRHYLKTPFLYAVHRIDRETSGILLFARGQASLDYFDALFEKHELQREYLAIVEGNVRQDEGRWESYLIEKPNYEVVTCTSKEGKIAITHFSVLRRSKKFTYLRLRLETGRKHQIRVHCREAGHPILGDRRYGSLIDPAKRMCLHATLLSFIHPLTKKEVTFSSPLPPSFFHLGAHL